MERRLKRGRSGEGVVEFIAGNDEEDAAVRLESVCQKQIRMEAIHVRRRKRCHCNWLTLYKARE